MSYTMMRWQRSRKSSQVSLTNSCFLTSISFILYTEATPQKPSKVGRKGCVKHMNEKGLRNIFNNTKTCWYCGGVNNEAPSYQKERVYCKSCLPEHKKQDDHLMSSYLDKKMRVMWRRAVNDIEKQGFDMDDYYEEAQIVLEMATEDLNKFQSSPEMMVAMELLRNRIPTKVQHKILRYRVDFLLPEWKVVLEVDGQLHDYRIKKDSNRDVAIMTELNEEENGWEILRIPTKHINQNIQRLIPAIKALYNERQRLRRIHGGFLPNYYSKHDTAQKMKVIKSLGTEESKRDVHRMSEKQKDWVPDEL